MPRPSKNLRPIQVRKLYQSLAYSPSRVERLFFTLDKLEAHSIPPGELSIAFVCDEILAQMHAKFMNDPTPTDVITFPGDAEMSFAGEICVSVDHALKAAPKYGNTLARELTLYLVHGWLHLAGYDDTQTQNRKKMRTAEKQTLRALEAAHSIPNFRIV